MNGNLDPDEVISERLLREIKSRVLYRTGMGRYSLVYDVTSYSEEVRAMTKRALMDLGFECFTIGDAAECSERYFQVVWR